jgi:predicted metal-dependent hydrolase
MEHFLIEGIPYQVKVNRLARNIKITIRDPILVTIPRKSLMAAAHQFAQERLNWIKANYVVQAGLNPNNAIKILDEEFMIRYEKSDKPRVVEQNGEIIVYAESLTLFRSKLKQYLKTHYGKIIMHRVAELAEQYGFAYNNISIRDQSTRWGSCSVEKNLNFNWRLILAPVKVMDYVIIHELAHTIHMNHGSKFWDVVKNFEPNYKAYVKWLKQNQKVLFSY